MTQTDTPKLVFDTDWSYAPAPETVPVRIDDRYGLFINGEFVEPGDGKYFDTINPANRQRLAEVAETGEADVDKAVKAARNAYENVWSTMPAGDRGKYLYRIARILQERAREFAIIETMDGGKPMRVLRWHYLPDSSST